MLVHAKLQVEILHLLLNILVRLHFRLSLNSRKDIVAENTPRTAIRLVMYLTQPPTHIQHTHTYTNINPAANALFNENGTDVHDSRIPPGRA